MLHPMLKFAHLAPHVWQALDELPRAGWVRNNVSYPESVALHTIRLIIMWVEMQSDFPELNCRERGLVSKMLELHDWPESDPSLGDIPSPLVGDGPGMLMSKLDKSQLEHTIMQGICANIPTYGEQLYTIWSEYEAHATLASKIASELDKLQAIHQAAEYEMDGFAPGITWSFYNSCQYKITHPKLRSRLDDIMASPYIDRDVSGVK